MPRGWRRFLALIAAAACALLAAPGAWSATFTVDSVLEGTDANVADGVCASSAGTCTLRAAIEQANASAGADTIAFGIGTTGTDQTIVPGSPLPNITDAATIDGRTQGGVAYSGRPLIHLDGQGVTPTAGTENGLTAFATGSVSVFGLMVYRFPDAGIAYIGNGGGLVRGNYVGIDQLNTDLGNNIGIIAGSNLTVGGADAPDRNVISGNAGGMIFQAASGSTVQGNYIGTTVSGGAALPNGEGIFFDGGASGDILGNVISGNTQDGLRIQDGAYTIKGNLIGVAADGTSPLGNGGHGIDFDQFGSKGASTIGDFGAGANVIANNGGDGISVEAGPAPGGGTSSGSRFSGNSIHSNVGLGIDLGDDGVTPLGTAGIPNRPVLTTATQSSGTLSFTGTLTTDPTTAVTIELYTSPAGDPSGFGEGRTLIGSISTASDASGNVDINGSFPSSAGNPSVLTATQTTGTRITSEFSNAQVISGAADDVDPTVSVTAPAAGAVLRGTVPVAADASDNVGVVAVDFAYFNGPTRVTFATDTTEPYQGTFDSTAVANTLPAGFTVYAFARDAAGNETGVGNSAMIDNPPSRIVFETNRNGNSEIYRMDPNGANPTRLTNSAATDTRPSLSPDGSLITWQRGTEIWLMNSDGTNQHVLTTGAADSSPAFSPDGTKIAFVRTVSGDDDIWVMNADGTGASNVTNTPGRDGSPSWSPDGSKIAFDSDRTGAGDIYTMNADGTEQGLVPGGDSAASDTDPDWSPNGAKIAFVSARGTFTSVWTVDAGGTGGALNVTNAPIFDADPSWSPDGTRIAFVRDAGGQTFNVHVAAADGSTSFPPSITFAPGTQRNSFPDWGALAADSAQAGPTFTVTTAADTVPDGCTEADCTLREAIEAANAHADNPDDPDEIHFAIPGSGLQVISPGIPLPAITGDVTIDGTTQTGFLADPVIFVDGSTTDCGVEVCTSDGLTVADATGVTIKGLAIGNFSGWGIALTGGSDNVVESSWIGIDPATSFVLGAGNSAGGIRVTGSSNNRIGGPTALQRVVVASNNSAGTGDSAQIVIAGASSANVVQGSYIGLEPDGETSNDTEHGVKITGGASGNRIGGDSSAGEGNVVYGFYGSGVLLESAGSDNVVAGNLIGRANDGAIGEAPEIGVDVVDSPSSIVGDDVVPPGFASPVRGNVILGADTAGVHVDGISTGTVITGNFVGVDRDGGETSLGNFDGVLVSTSNVNVGPGNTISRNTDDGVELELETVQNVRIVANSISDNGALGIDRQTFANSDTKAPTLASATAGAAVTTVSGTVGPGLADGTYFVEFFSNTTCDPSGAGEGAVYIGFAQAVVSSGAGSASFSQALPLLPVGTQVTATTTSATASTSEFSTCRAVTTGAAESVVTLAPEADTFVTGADTGTNFGTLDYFDTYGGFNASCVPYSAPAYGLLRFDLSGLPAGTISDAKLVLTSRAGYAQDGDPNHYAIRLSNDSWTETGVNWDNRPSDGTVAPGDPTLGGGDGGDIRTSSLSLGADFVWRNTCGSDFAGNQTKVFPTNSNSVKTLAAARADMIAAIQAEAAGDDKLSIEIYNPNCASCPAGANTAYWARYYSKEAADPAVRPKLVVTYSTDIDVTTFTATPPNPVAGVAQVKETDVPAAALFTRDQTTGSTPLADTPLGDTPLADTPLADTPLGDTPLADTSLGLGDVIAQLRTIPLSSLPLLREGGWPAVLANTVLATRALQNVTLGDVFALTPRPAALDGQGTDEIRLEELDLSRSSLGDVAAIAFALGSGVTLAELGGATQLDPTLQAWCTATGTSCPTTSILALGLQGAPLADTPLGDTPLGDTPLADTPLGDTPLADTPLGDTPLGDTPLADTPLGDTPLADTPLGDTPLGDTDLSQAPLSDTPLGDTPLGDTPLADTDLNQAPLGDTPLGDTPLADTPLGDTPLGDTPLADTANCSAVYTFNDCATRGGTLDDHRNELQPGVTIAEFVAALTQAARERLTLGDLVASLADPDDFTLAQLLAVLPLPTDYTLAHVVAVLTDAAGLTILDLVNSLPNPNDFTLNDLLAAVLRATAEWESVDVSQPEIVRASTGGGSTQLQAALSLTGPGSQLTFTLDLPRGWTTTDSSFPTIESVPPGATSLLDVVGTVPTADGGTRVTLRTQTAVGGNQLFKITVRPGTRLGPATPTLAVSAGGTPVAAPATSVDVQQTFEPNDDPATATPLTTGTLYLSYIASAADSDFFRFTVPATGTRTTFRLGHLPADYDLVVYGPAGSQLVTGTADPLETPVLGDSGAPITHLSEALPSETLDDLTLLTDRPVLGVSAFRTTEDDTVAIVSDGAPGDYVVQVTGYNGASSVDPYMLRVETEAPRLAPTCQGRFPTLGFGSGTGVPIASIPTDADTLFLANGPQLAALGGQSVLDWFTTTHLNSLRTTGHPSALVRLENDPAVRTAYTSWNQQPCSTVRANAVVSAITNVIATIRAQRPSVRNVVLLGADTALPFARIDDLTTVANEADYASTFARNEDPYGALFEHKLLSDDPYGTTQAIPYLQRRLFVPQLAVGRLVETPAQITGALDRFLAFGGILDPTSARTSGYDFLSNGAGAVAAAFATITGGPQPTTNPPLIGDLWTKSTLAGALSTTTGLFGMNGHADHRRLQPARDADGDGRFLDTDLFTAADLPASLTRSVIFSMGCHSGYSASDAAVGAAVATDWAQTFAGKGAAAYAGNLGFGYGDTVTIAYSEALNVRLAEGLRDGLPIGQALVEAKQSYLAGLGLVGVYDEKAMAELALYGLPMWSLDAPATAAAAAAPATAPAAADTADTAGTVALAAAAPPAGVTRLSTDTDPITGLAVDHWRSEPALTEKNVPNPNGGRYWEGPSGVQVTHLRPLQPKVEFGVADDAHGLLITGLQSTDVPNVDPVYARPIVDNVAAEPELPFADVAFPAKIQTLVSQQTVTGRRVDAVLVHGQFFSNATADAAGDGTQRLFSRVELDVLRSSSADRLAPQLDNVDAALLDPQNLVSFSLDAVDLPGNTADDVVRVLVAWRDETSSTWNFLDLAHGTGAGWGGTAQTTGHRVEFFAQAVDRAGNVAVTTNKGLLYIGAPPPPLPTDGGVQPTVTPSLGGTQIAGWFKPAAVLDVDADAGVEVTFAVDGGAFQPFTGPVTLSGDGLHVVDVHGSNGYEARLFVPVDSHGPTVAIDQPGTTVPLNGSVPLAFRCGDASSGVASCTAKLDNQSWTLGTPVKSSPLGSTHTIVVTATDRVGNTTTSPTFSYTVTARGFVYTSSSTGSGDIYSLPVGATPTTVPTRLTATSFPEADPVWSPDSRRIAFASNRDGTWRIYVMDADGTDTVQVPTGTGDATEPAWSPAGNEIAFVSTRTGNPDIWAVRLDGTNLRRLTTDTKLDVSPAWAPNNLIAWSNGPGGQLDIWTMTGTGASKKRITNTQDVITDASWKSDGTIAFARRAKGTARFELWTMTATGGSQTKLFAADRNDLQPTWLQDGRIVFATDRDDTRDFDLFRATKSGNRWTQVRVTNAVGDERAPNG